METAAKEPALSRKKGIAGEPDKRRRLKKLQPAKVEEIASNNSSGDEEDEKVEVENKVVALRRIVPGGESADNVDELFEETAGYILELQNQIQALKFLARVFEVSQKDLRKFGG